MKRWDAGDKALLLVEHTTHLRYEEPIVEAHREFRMTPVDTGLQRVVSEKLEVDPAANLRSFFDYFGTHVHYVSRLEPHDALTIRANAVVETTNAICCGPSLPPDFRPESERLAEYVQWSPAVPDLPDYQDIKHRVDLGLGREAFLDSLQEIGATFQSHFQYDPIATDIHASPEVLFQTGEGVCQDLAHALIGVLRLASVPCRYVGGYVYNPMGEDDGDRVEGATASHAWVQVWHPELGWVGIDPTNDKLVDWQYIRVAVGRDYADVQPLRSVFVGYQEQEIDIEISVKRIG